MALAESIAEPPPKAIIVSAWQLQIAPTPLTTTSIVGSGIISEKTVTSISLSAKRLVTSATLPDSTI